ncbi:MAG: exodeoxyribonuclease VII large subunit [Eubacteriales bacterium]|nr:exodeoxyribonuclease VII large subunit [Eubacteriales bacterium]
MANETTRTVTEINGYIKRIMDGDFLLRRVHVTGEISNYRPHPSGHCYFTLKDEHAELAAVMFKREAETYRHLLANGRQVVLSGRISVFERTGRYQLYVNAVREEGTGLLHERFENLKKELKAAGYFEKERKKPIPAFPRHIGIVTASQGAALQDMKKVALGRNPHVMLYLYPAQVQGETAAASIADALDRLDRRGLDVIVIGRGGGSMEDLWAFNERVVADAIFRAETPVVSAVGHETDLTISDFVADLRAATPSAAMEILVTPLTNIRNRMDHLRQQLRRLTANRLQVTENRLRQFELALQRRHPEVAVQERIHRLAWADGRLRELLKERITGRYHRLQELRYRLMQQSPVKRMETCRLRTNRAAERLTERMDAVMRRTVHAYKDRVLKLEGLSPLDRLSSGWLLAMYDGKRLIDTGDVSPGDRMQLYARTECLDVEVIEKTALNPEGMNE